MMGSIEESKVSRTECDGPSRKVCIENIVAEGVTFVSFAAAVFTATRASKTAEDDGVTDAGGFRKLVRERGNGNKVGYDSRAERESFGRFLLQFRHRLIN
jgi:hypothetical protein